MLKVLFIEANSTWLIKRSDLSDLEQIIPPLGLMYIATCLKNQFGDSVSVRLISRKVDCNTQQELVDILKEYIPDIVGIRGLNIYKKLFHETAKTVKQFNEDIIVIGGGPYVTMDVQEAMNDKNIDYCVMGEGEVTFAELIRNILTQQSLFDVQGIAYRNNSSVLINSPRQLIGNLDCLPFPDYSLISINKYSNFINYGYNRRKQAVIFSSRGCPYDCIYCHNIFGKSFRARSPRNVFDEIKKLYSKFNIKDFYFIDDNFNLDYRRAMEIFDLIIDSNMKINIYLTNGIRGDIIDRAFIDKMIKAGVIWVGFAIETVSERLQKFIKKFINLEKIVENINYACEKNIMVNCYIMVGFPTETIKEANQTIDYLKQFKKIIIPMFFSVKYYPNSEIYNLALKHGIMIDNIRDAYAVPYHDIKYCETPLISKYTFRDIYFRFLKEVFLSKERLQNAIDIQKIFLTKQEIFDIYSIFFKKRVKDLQKDVLRHAY